MIGRADSGALEFRWQEGELYISDREETLRIRAWPQPAAFIEAKGRAAKPVRPDMRLLKPEVPIAPALPDANAAPLSQAEEAKIESFRQLRLSIPVEFVALVERFRSHQWNLLDLLDKDNAALDLARANPTLFFCLANNDQFLRLVRITPAEKARGQLARKQREIAGWLGFPETDAAVKLLHKIPAETATPHDMRLLRLALLSDAEVQPLLAHLRPINAGVLGLVCNLKLLALITPRLLAEVGRDEEETHFSRTADLLVDALYARREGRMRIPVSPFASKRAVRDFHDRVMAEWARREEERRAHEEAARERRRAAAERAQRRAEERARRRAEGRAQREAEMAAWREQERARIPKRKAAAPPPSFPSPPIPGNEDIIPLTDEGQLYQEGLLQSNCVSQYARKVRGRYLYVYRVLRPERATLAIVRGPDGSWRRSELELAHNARAGRRTQDAVDRWLSAYAMSV